MSGAPSSTWFSASPHWGWLIASYFFLGGLAGGCYFLASLIDLIGRPQDRPLARLGYYVAFPCLVLSGLVLSLDLGRPLRFWHMLIQSNTYRPMFKYWSPMSIGSWALSLFGFFSVLAFVGALAEEDRLRWSAVRTLHARWPFLARLLPPSPLGRAIAAIGAVLGLYVAGYTGVLLAVTNRPIWSDTPLLGMLFIVSAASTSAAMIVLLAHRFEWRLPGVSDLHRMERWMIALELLVLVLVIASLGPVARAWLNVWGVLLAIVILLGMIAPLALAWRARRTQEWNPVTGAVLVLVAGLLLRLVIVFSSRGYLT